VHLSRSMARVQVIRFANRLGFRDVLVRAARARSHRTGRDQCEVRGVARSDASAIRLGEVELGV
jgi:hypothetical protein